MPETKIDSYMGACKRGVFITAMDGPVPEREIVLVVDDDGKHITTTRLTHDQAIELANWLIITIRKIKEEARTKPG